MPSKEPVLGAESNAILVGPPREAHHRQHDHLGTAGWPNIYLLYLKRMVAEPIVSGGSGSEPNSLQTKRSHNS
jgi:hypothetical protein